MSCFTLIKVFSGKFHFIRSALLLAGTMVAATAGNFALPAEGPVAFRRDRVPLDVDTISKLSAQLVTLADGMEDNTPGERRGAAQMLALALALDPGNGRARKVLKEFENGEHMPDIDLDGLASSRVRIWQWISWLDTAEAGTHGQALAACLKDVSAISDPKDPRAEELLANGEKGAWAGWIPATVAYEEPDLVEITPKDDSPQQPTEPLNATLTKATVSTPLWRAVDKSEPTQWALALAPLQMEVASTTEDDGSHSRFSVILGRTETDEQLKRLIEPLRELLTVQHGRLPAGRTVTINSPELQTSLRSNKRQSISGAVAVLASAAVTGLEPSAAIIGTLDSKGTFKLPTNFWDHLRAVKSGTGGRLVLPAEAAAYLPSILAMENPKFFMDHEVVLAADFEQLLNLSAKKPDDAFGKISAQFREIREKMGSQPLGPYVANGFIRRRLAEIAQAAPYHYSAKMLAIQGAGNRPIYVIRPVVISELRRAIEPLEWVVEYGHSYYETAQANALGTTFEKCRGEIERLLRYTEKADRELVDQVLTMVTLLRPMERAAKAKQNPDDYGSNNALDSAISAFLRSHADVSRALGLTQDGQQGNNR